MAQPFKNVIDSVNIDPAKGSADDAARQSRLEAAMEEVVKTLERDESFDRDSLLTKYPDIADELADCLNNVDFIHETKLPRAWQCEPSTSSRCQIF